MNLTKSEIRHLTQILILANTPSYLHRRMSESQSVQMMAETVKEGELVSRYQSIAKKKQRSPEEVAVAYACLVALGMKHPLPDQTTLEDLRNAGMDWGANVLDIILSRPSSATIAEMTIPEISPSIESRASSKRAAANRPVSNATKTIKIQ